MPCICAHLSLYRSIETYPLVQGRERTDWERDRLSPSFERNGLDTCTPQAQKMNIPGNTSCREDLHCETGSN